MGVTSILDGSHIGNSPEHTDAAIQGLRESGIRAVYAFGGGTPGPGDRFPGDIRRLRREHFSSADQLPTLAMAAGTNPGDWTIARAVGAPISIHVVGSLGLATREVMGPDVTCIHCTGLPVGAWEAIASSGGHVSIAGPIEMRMNHGVPPVQQALQRQRAGDVDAPALLSVRDVIEFATLRGAMANRLDARTGSLTPGKQADVIMLRADEVNVLPLNNAYGSVVLGGHLPGH